jgi:hypothetical protein
MKNLGTTPAYNNLQKVTSDGTGTAIAYFSSLTPGGHYSVDLSYDSSSQTILKTVTFYTFASDTQDNTTKTDLSTKGGGLLPPCPDTEKGCGFKELLDMVNIVVNFILFRMAVPIAAIMFAYAGFMLVTSGGESSKRTKAKSIFINVLIGLIVAAAAWLIVHTILNIVGYQSSWGTWLGF